MTVKDLIRAELKESEEEDQALEEIEIVKAEPEERIAPDDEMFCTAAGATSVRPKAGHKSLLRRLLAEADRA